MYGCCVGRNQWLPESGLSWDNTGSIQAWVLVLVKWEGKLEMSSSWWSLDPEVSYNIIWWCGFFLSSPPGRAWHMQRVIWSSDTVFRPGTRQEMLAERAGRFSFVLSDPTDYSLCFRKLNTNKYIFLGKVGLWDTWGVVRSMIQVPYVSWFDKAWCSVFQPLDLVRQTTESPWTLFLLL